MCAAEIVREFEASVMPECSSMVSVELAVSILPDDVQDRPSLFNIVEEYDFKDHSATAYCQK